MTDMKSARPYVIVFGNEKGGTGKSTLSMHLITHLLRLGFSVGSLDIDARQGTLTRYVENRRKTLAEKGFDLPTPDHHPLLKSDKSIVAEAQEEEKNKLESTLNALSSKDFIVIDTPGSDAFLSRLAHSYADTLITPMNDSLVDLDMLARVDPQTGNILGPATYAQMVWEQRMQRAKRDRGNFDWIVVRNRLSSIHSKNKVQITEHLAKLAQRIGFRVAAGFGERVIFRELFLQGLTLLDLQAAGIPFSVSHVAARHELRSLLMMIKLPRLEEKLAQVG